MNGLTPTSDRALPPLHTPPQSHMKTSPHLRLLHPAITVLLCLFLAGRGQAEDVLQLESIHLDGKAVKNVRVTKATPTELTVFHEGGGVTLQRSNLPPELQVHFPYDATAATAFRRQQAAERELKEQESKARQERANQEYRAMLLRQRQAHKTQIAVLERDLAKVHEAVDASRPRFARRLTQPERQDLERLTKQQKDLRLQIDDLNGKVTIMDRQLALLAGPASPGVAGDNTPAHPSRRRRGGAGPKERGGMNNLKPSLSSIQQGDAEAAEEPVPLGCEELRKRADTCWNNRMTPDHEPDALREQAPPCDPPPETQRMIDEFTEV